MLLWTDTLSPEFKEPGAEDGLTFFATHLHAHSFGRQLWLEHVRDQKVIGTFGENRAFKGYGSSQNYQFYRATHNFLAGDALRGHCIYNTSQKQEWTQYGVDHGDEMCAFLLFYYPHVLLPRLPQNHLCSLLQGFNNNKYDSKDGSRIALDEP